MGLMIRARRKKNQDRKKATEANALPRKIHSTKPPCSRSEEETRARKIVKIFILTKIIKIAKCMRLPG
ncbi:hypothetical protein DPMN_170726 [Dreissena polymorpha]|uniref:Uncharacterized protein n=1 Tax=Dreissena polymorpha TaxID=45954 RepID=A0A9D4E0B9_DREPO|nr:hypothetical protein DPMN_170726 [Dreissena polymorpha]